MRFFTTLVAAATFGFAVAQGPEAARFGIVQVNPSTTSPGQTIQITYNSTVARFQPKFVDFYLQGHITPDRPTPYYLLSRNSYGESDKVLIQDVTVPPVAAGGWDLWAFITFDKDGSTQVGGIAAGLAIN